MSVAKIAISVAGGGPWMSFALDAFDTAFSVATGEMSLGDGALSLAKGAATAAVADFTSGLCKSWTTSWSDSLGAFGGAALAKSATYAMNATASIAIDAFNMKDGKLGWGMDKDVLKKRIKSAGIRTVTSGLAAGISHSIVASAGGKYGKLKNGKYGWNLKAGNTGLNWSGLKNIEKYGNLAGGLTEQAINGISGEEVVLNLANFGMFGGPDMGFLELHFGKGVKTGLNFGTGGLDVSANAWSMASQGMEDVSFLKKYNSKDSGIHRSMDKVDIVNLMRYSKDATAMATSRAIINGEIDMKFDAEGLNKNLAKNQGYNDRGNNAFYLSDRLVSGSLNDMALGAVIGSHEGAHMGYGPITESQGLDKLYDVDVNVWRGLKNTFKGLKNVDLDTMDMVKRMAKKSGDEQIFYDYINENYDTEDETARLRKSKNKFVNSIIETFFNQLTGGNINWGKDGNAKLLRTLLKGQLPKGISPSGLALLDKEKSLVFNKMKKIVESDEEFSLDNIEHVRMLFNGVFDPYSSLDKARIFGEGDSPDGSRFNAINAEGNLKYKEIVFRLTATSTPVEFTKEDFNIINDILEKAGYMNDVAKLSKDELMEKFTKMTGQVLTSVDFLNTIAINGFDITQLGLKGLDKIKDYSIDGITKLTLSKISFNPAWLGIYAMAEKLLGFDALGANKPTRMEYTVTSWKDSVFFNDEGARFNMDELHASLPDHISQGKNNPNFNNWSVMKYRGGPDLSYGYAAVSPYGQVMKMDSNFDPYAKYKFVDKNYAKENGYKDMINRMRINYGIDFSYIFPSNLFSRFY